MSERLPGRHPTSGNDQRGPKGRAGWRLAALGLKFLNHCPEIARLVSLLHHRRGSAYILLTTDGGRGGRNTNHRYRPMNLSCIDRPINLISATTGIHGPRPSIGTRNEDYFSAEPELRFGDRLENNRRTAALFYRLLFELPTPWSEAIRDDGLEMGLQGLQIRRFKAGVVDPGLHDMMPGIMTSQENDNAGVLELQDSLLVSMKRFPAVGERCAASEGRGGSVRTKRHITRNP